MIVIIKSPDGPAQAIAGDYQRGHPAGIGV